MLDEFFGYFEQKLNQIEKFQSTDPYQKLTEEDLMFDQHSLIRKMLPII